MIHMVIHVFILLVIWFRHRKDELERRMSALQESRRELMVQLEGLMRLLRVRNLLDNNLTLYFPRHVWKHHLFAHFFSSPFSFSPLSVWRICFHSLSYLIFWLTGWRAETGSKCSFNTALQFWSKHAGSQLQKFDLAYVLCMAKQNEWDFFPTKLWKQWKCYKYTLKLLHDSFDYHHITLKVRASFTKQGKLVWECNSKRAPMEVDISAGDY